MLRLKVSCDIASDSVLYCISANCVARPWWVAVMERTGIHVQQIKRYEANTSQPSADALKKIAKCFGRVSVPVLPL